MLPPLNTASSKPVAMHRSAAVAATLLLTACTGGGSPRAAGGAGGIPSGTAGSAASSGGMTTSAGAPGAAGSTASTAGSSAAGGGAGGSSAGAAQTGGGITGGMSSTVGEPSTGGSPPASPVRFLGRVDASDKAAVKLGWSGSGVLASVQGTKISVRLRTDGGADTAFFQPVVDGTAGKRFQVPSGDAQTIVLADNLSDSAHRVELYRESESNFGYSSFLGFVDGKVLTPPTSPTRLIEVVGDSISAGYGSLGMDVHPPYDKSCAFSLDTESAYVTYGMLLGRALDAEVSIVARSGWGMYRDVMGNTSNVVPSIYGTTLGSPTPFYDFARRPDAVIVNLGTNDSASTDPGADFENAYLTFLQTLRTRNPSAWIFLTIGPMTADPMLTTMRTHLTNVVMRFADAKVTTVPIDVQDGSTTGCDYHPNVAEHQRMATALQKVIKTQLGW